MQACLLQYVIYIPVKPRVPRWMNGHSGAQRSVGDNKRIRSRKYDLTLSLRPCVHSSIEGYPMILGN